MTRAPAAAGSAWPCERAGPRIALAAHAFSPNRGGRIRTDDLSPRRPLYQAELPLTQVKFISALTGLEIPLPLKSLGASGIFLMVHQRPRYAVPRGLAQTGIVTTEPVLKVPAGTDISAPSAPTSKNIHDKHNRGGRIRTDDFLHPKQALYQAELHPVDRSLDHCSRSGRPHSRRSLLLPLVDRGNAPPLLLSVPEPHDRFSRTLRAGPA